MVLKSKSGLMPASKKFIKNSEKGVEPRIEFQLWVTPAKFTLKPLSSIVNPYRHGCSILCNHPTTNVELRRAIKKTTRYKDEPEDCGVDKKALVDRVGEVLEEMLLSRYRREETSSNITKDIVDSSDEGLLSDDRTGTGVAGNHRTVLVLDLRRTASQETIATREGRETSAEGKSIDASPSQSSISATSQSQSLMFVSKGPQTPVAPVEEPQQIIETTATTDEATADETDVQKRRGKIRKKKKSGKNISVLPDDRGSKEVVGLIEPGETQVSACNETGADDFRSGQTSATPAPPDGSVPPVSIENQRTEKLFPVSDLFDEQTLRHLRRTITVHDAEAHFRSIWRKVLEEAIKVSEITPEEEMKHVREKVYIEPSQPENWIGYPRAFAYQTARFDLPINKDKLNGMTPLEYLRDYVAISKRHNLLYDYVFNKYTEYKINEIINENDEVNQNKEKSEENNNDEDLKETEDNRPRERFILGKSVIAALGEVMSRPFTDEEANKLHGMINWSDEDKIDLKTWIGLCALSERVFGYQFSSGKNPNLGMPQLIEQVDFENLLEKLPRLNLRSDLYGLLMAIREAYERTVEDDLDISIYGYNNDQNVQQPVVSTTTNSATGDCQVVRRIPRIGIVDDDDSDAEYFNSENVDTYVSSGDEFTDEEENVQESEQTNEIME
ncbi:hypothetical protein O3M35_011541 [Rhynocoris fuscipes]|uniref:Uncharacterized protein n=1 Tax=Rhynocoris fuscipes TaxID=488301 RepID=A0AAW1CWL6_9HEMI